MWTVRLGCTGCADWLGVSALHGPGPWGMSGLGVVSFFMLLYCVSSLLFGGGGVTAVGGVGGCPISDY